MTWCGTMCATCRRTRGAKTASRGTATLPPQTVRCNSRCLPWHDYCRRKARVLCSYGLAPRWLTPCPPPSMPCSFPYAAVLHHQQPDAQHQAGAQLGLPPRHPGRAPWGRSHVRQADRLRRWRCVPKRRLQVRSQHGRLLTGAPVLSERVAFLPPGPADACCCACVTSYA